MARLTFLHWPFEAAHVQRLLPGGLERLGDRGNEIAYLSRRRWPGPRPATSRLRIGIGTPIAQGDITALEHFLTATRRVGVVARYRSWWASPVPGPESSAAAPARAHRDRAADWADA